MSWYLLSGLILVAAAFISIGSPTRRAELRASTTEVQLTKGPGGRILTNCAVWSPDGKWIVYDTRSDKTGDKFDGTHIEMVNVESREVRRLYESTHGAN